MNGNEFTKLFAELSRLAQEVKGMNVLLSEKFKPVDMHLKESLSFRDKVIKNCTSIFFLKLILISILVPTLLGIVFAGWKLLTAWAMK